MTFFATQTQRDAGPNFLWVQRYVLPIPVLTRLVEHRVNHPFQNNWQAFFYVLFIHYTSVFRM